MKYFSVPLKFDGFYSPDVNVAYTEHRHFDTNLLKCKISVSDQTTVDNGVELTEEEWRNI
jgi:hypothetical protein